MINDELEETDSCRKTFTSRHLSLITTLDIEHLLHAVHVGATHEAGMGKAALTLGAFLGENV